MANSILYTTSAAPNGSQGLIWGEVDYTFSAKYSNTYSRLTFAWLGECWQGVSQYEGTTYTYDTGTISVTANGKTFSGTISGYRSHSVSSSKYEWSESNATLGYIDIARSTKDKSVTISLVYKYEGNTYTGSTTVTVPALPTYTIKYAANGGSGTTTSQTKTYGTTLTLHSALTRTGYNFSKWKASDNTLYSAGASYTKNEATTLTAQWTAKTYEVKYSANNGTGAPSTQTKTHGQNLTLSSTTPTRTGYTFSKWNTKSDGTGTSYSPGGSYTANEGTTLYAQWTVCKKTFVFNANSGTGTMSNQVISYASSGTTALTSNTFTRSGYTFSKWNTKDDGTGTNYNNEASITRSSITSNSTIDLYAQWATAFVAPKINSLKAVRSSNDNTEAAITVGLTKGSNAGTVINTTYVKIQYKRHSASDWSDGTTNSTTDTTYTHTLTGLSDVQYDIQVTIYSKDYSNTTVSKIVFLSSTSYTIDINAAGTAIGFFRIAPDAETGIYIDDKVMLNSYNNQRRWITVRQNDASVISYGVNESGMHGLFSDKGSRWMIQAPTDGTYVTINEGSSSQTYVAGNLKIASDIYVNDRITQGAYPASTDFNAFTKSGFYYCTGMATNGPTSATLWGLLVIASTTGTGLVQIAIPVSAYNYIYVRHRYDSAWGAWKRVGISTP